MKYIEFRVYASRQGIEQLTALFLSQGIDSVSIDDPADMEDVLNKKNSYDWDYIEDSLREDLGREPAISAYFDDNEENRMLTAKLGEEVSMLGLRAQEGAFGEYSDLGSLRTETIVSDDSEWKDKWKEFFKPVKVTERLVIKPTWEEYTPQEGDVVLQIDPGMAFGTGTHETTSLCLKMIEKYIGKDCADTRVLDVGCGSGILSIAAALLGARDVVGIDIDEDAVSVARENTELNGVSGQVRIMYGDLVKGIDYKADMIVANLMADLVVMLSESARKHLVPGGIFISSGILTEKKQMVSEAVKAAGFDIIEIADDGEWCAIAARGR